MELIIKFFNIILISFLSISSLAQNNIIETARSYIIEDFKELVFVSIKEQKLYHIKNEKIINTFIISSSKYGTGNMEGSNKTPLGLHKIREKHGEKTPINGKMLGRKFYGKIAKIHTDKSRSKTDDVTTRIFWLEGLEKGKNKGEGIDSYKRYIYIHGTSEEGRIGSPASHGCIRMKNKDIINLYKRVEVGTLVLIL
tara:strand:- start:357 stop:947 length:591 start_codon:yes stop_codon:yes gene_type:complete